MTVEGDIIDLSSDNDHPIDYEAVAGAGIIAAFVKATQGTTYTNPDYPTDVAGLTAVGIPVLGYHFADFTVASAEAAHFVSIAGARARVLDSETNTNAAWQNAFLAALGVAGNQELDYGSASTLPPSGIRSLLWPADYSKNPGFGDCWQFSDVGAVPGITGDVDLSTWVGSEADFDSLFSITPPTPSSPGDPMFASDPVTGGIWGTDENGDVYADLGAPFIPGLNTHPAYQAGSAESGGKNPCVGIAYWRSGATDGIVLFTKPSSGIGGWSGTPYNQYRFLRNGTPA